MKVALKNFPKIYSVLKSHGWIDLTFELMYSEKKQKIQKLYERQSLFPNDSLVDQFVYLSFYKKLKINDNDILMFDFKKYTKHYATERFLKWEKKKLNVSNELFPFGEFNYYILSVDSNENVYGSFDDNIIECGNGVLNSLENIIEGNYSAMKSS